MYICNIMKRIVILFILTLAIYSGLDARVVKPIRLNPGSGNVAPVKPIKLHSDNTLIVYYNNAAGKKSLLKAIKNYGATILYNYNSINCLAIKLPQGKNVDEAKAHFEKVKGVVQVNYDKIMQLK